MKRWGSNHFLLFPPAGYQSTPLASQAGLSRHDSRRGRKSDLARQADTDRDGGGGGLQDFNEEVAKGARWARRSRGLPKGGGGHLKTPLHRVSFSSLKRRLSQPVRRWTTRYWIRTPSRGVTTHQQSRHARWMEASGKTTSTGDHLPIRAHNKRQYPHLGSREKVGHHR